jgi:hypothetical protein
LIVKLTSRPEVPVSLLLIAFAAALALLIGTASYAVMRLWSAFDFIPRALAFERAAPESITESAARAWTRRSHIRLPLDLVTCTALLSAFATAVRLG